MLDAAQAEASKAKSEAEAAKKSAVELWDRFSSSTSRFLFLFLTKHPINECGTRCSVFLVQMGHNSHLHKLISITLK